MSHLRKSARRRSPPAPAPEAAPAERLRDRSDERLVADFLAGDDRAFDQIVRRYEPRLRRFAARLVVEPSDAFDVVQESFIRAWRGLRRFRGDAKLGTWLSRIVVNCAANHRERQGRHRTWARCGPDGEDLPPEQWLADSDTPERLLQGEDLRALLDEALDELPDKLREPILLHEYKGLTYEAIADVVAVPVGTVRSRIFRARRHIEARIEPLVAN